MTVIRAVCSMIINIVLLLEGSVPLIITANEEPLDAPHPGLEPIASRVGSSNGPSFFGINTHLYNCELW